MASGRRISKAVVDRLKPGSAAWDMDVRGFGVRRQRRDAVYVLKYRAGGKQRLYTIGLHGSPWTPDKARSEAVRLRGLIAAGSDPAAGREATKAVPFFDEFADTYLREVSEAHKKPSTVKEERRIVAQILKPRLRDRRVTDIDRADVARLHSALRETPTMANRAKALLSHVINVAVERGIRPEGTNPCQRVKNYPEGRRERFLTSEELGRLGTALAEAETTGIPWAPSPAKKVKHAPREENRRAFVDPYASAAIRLLLFTGARLREILHLRWEHFDAERGLLLLPDSKTGRKTIILNAPALAVLAGLDPVGEFVILGESKKKPRADLKRPWARVAGRAGLSGVRIHDLRHTFASFGAGRGLGLPIVGKLLGHAQPSTTARYAHLDADPLRRAANTIGSEIESAMKKEVSKMRSVR